MRAKVFQNKVKVIFRFTIAILIFKKPYGKEKKRSRERKMNKMRNR